MVTPALMSSFTTWKCEECKNVNTSSHYPDTCVVKSQCRTLPLWADSMEQTDERYDVCAAVIAGFTVHKKFGAVSKAVIVGNMSSLRHLMIRGGVQICNVPLDTCQDLWLLSTLSCLSGLSIQTPSVYKGMQKVL